MDDNNPSRLIAESGLIVILRNVPLEVLEPVATSLREAGVRVVEVALNSPKALEQIRHLKRYDFCLGAGTALDETTSAAAIKAGARFLFSPVCSTFFLRLCRQRRVLPIPGALTPTEIYRLQTEGVEFIKLFPASLGGPDYIRDILAPGKDLQLVATGGVTLDTLAAYLDAGAAAVAIGKEIVDPQLVAEKNCREIGRRARRFVETIKSSPRFRARS